MSRHVSTGPSISLFPFLSILCCVIGSLTLIMASLSVSSMTAQADPAEEYAAIVANAVAAHAKAAELERLVNEAVALQHLIEDAQRKLEGLQKTTGQTHQDERQALLLVQQITELETRLQQLTEQLATVRAEIARLQTELQRRTTPASQQTIAIQGPTGGPGSGSAYRPAFVECRKEQLVFYLEPDFKPSTRVSGAEIDTSNPFHLLLKRVNSTPNMTLVFLIRPDGIKTYESAAKKVREDNIRNGYLPIPGDGPIDLSSLVRKVGPTTR